MTMNNLALMVGRKASMRMGTDGQADVGDRVRRCLMFCILPSRLTTTTACCGVYIQVTLQASFYHILSSMDYYGMFSVSREKYSLAAF